MQIDYVSVGIVVGFVALIVVGLLSRHYKWRLRHNLKRTVLRHMGLLDESGVYTEDIINENAVRGSNYKFILFIVLIFTMEPVVFLSWGAWMSGYVQVAITWLTGIGAIAFIVIIGYALVMLAYTILHVKHTVYEVDYTDSYAGTRVHADWALAKHPTDLDPEDPVFKRVYETIEQTKLENAPLFKALNKTNHRILLERTFVNDGEDARFLLLTDCPLDKHIEFFTRPTYVGVFPVEMPSAPLKLDRVGTLPVPQHPTTPDCTEATELQNLVGIPVITIVGSKEISRRIREGEALPSVDPKDMAAGELLIQGHMNVDAANRIQQLEKHVESQDVAIAGWQAQGAKETGTFTGLAVRTGMKPPEEPKPPRIPRKWLIRFGVLAAVLIAVAVFVLIGLPLLINWWLVTHP